METVTFPVTVSLADGSKIRFIEARCPGANVIGVEIPFAETSLAATVICDSVTLELPLFVIVTLLVVALPALTLPKLRLLGLEESVTDAAWPVPVSVATFGELGASLEMLTFPARLPAAAGAKSTLNVAVFPALIVVGVFRPLAL